MSRLSAKIRAWTDRPDDGRDPEYGELPVLQPLPREIERIHADWRGLTNIVVPEYPDVAPDRQGSAGSAPPIFITARFRSGSTLLWNVFRRTPGMTAYYEPLHPTLRSPANERVPALDPTHDGVDDYWTEYLRVDGLTRAYAEPWHCQDLYLDELDWKPKLAAYVQLLIRSARSRPVLQFNRVDFRLGWLRHQFPNARLVHLFRHPRDQWLSALRNPATFGPGDPLEKFAEHDYFFLLEWVEDLVRYFPVLDWHRVTHPYRMFYLLWKLSYVWGQAYSDLSLAYEQLLAAPRQTIGDMFELLGIETRLAAQVAETVRSKATGKWRTYADAEWFAAHERAAEDILDTFLGPAQELTSTSAALKASA